MYCKRYSNRLRNFRISRFLRRLTISINFARLFALFTEILHVPLRKLWFSSILLILLCKNCNLTYKPFKKFSFGSLTYLDGLNLMFETMTQFPFCLIPRPLGRSEIFVMNILPIRWRSHVGCMLLVRRQRDGSSQIIDNCLSGAW